MLFVPGEGKVTQVCTSGSRLAPVGVEGSMLLKGFVKYALPEESNPNEMGAAVEEIVFQSGLFWDSPFLRQKNRFNFTVAKKSNPKITLTCSDYNKAGGALGNIDCVLEGTIKEE